MTIDLTEHAASAGQAIVTDADVGVGRATALELAMAGFDVGLTWCADETSARELGEEIRRLGRWSELRELDVRRVAADPGTASVIDDLATALGGLSVLVCTGPTAPEPTAFVDQDAEAVRTALDVAVVAPAVLAQRAARHMIEQRVSGRLIHVTGVREHVVAAGAGAECAAQSALGAMAKVMALELAPHGITVNTVAPGEIATPRLGEHGVDPSLVDRPGIPAGRPAAAHEIARAIVYLAGPGADYVTGTSIVVDGGLVLTAGAAGARAGEVAAGTGDADLSLHA